MPESRDRLSRPVDIAAVFARRRADAIAILDESLDSALFGFSPRWNSTPARTTGRVTRFNARRGRGVENTPIGIARRGRGRASRSLLPSWYPRVPLRDITAITRAIERRRAHLGENEDEGQQAGSPDLADHSLLDPSESVSAAVSSSSQAVGVKLQTPAASKVPRILLDFTSKTEGESELLTPQKKLLNSIDTVEKVLKEEIQKFKRTPIARKAERERKVKTLMSMR